MRVIRLKMKGGLDEVQVKINNTITSQECFELFALKLGLETSSSICEVQDQFGIVVKAPRQLLSKELYMVVLK